jgi:hypothetical protein
VNQPRPACDLHPSHSSHGTNGAPLDLSSRITDAFIDSLGLLTIRDITVGPRKSGWAHLPELEQFQRVTNEFRMRHAVTTKVGLTDDQYALTLDCWVVEPGQPRWIEGGDRVTGS